MWTYRPELDGLRAVAVYLVLVFHCGMAAVSGGFIGVDVFFVLSGFLVTNVILDEIHRTGRLSLGNFYARRVRRLLPAAVLVVVATCAVFVLVEGTVRRLEILPDARAALLYVANWHHLLQANDYFADEVAPSPFLHFWSLAIEEQFYVVFPVVLLLLARRGRRRTTFWVVVALGAASLASQVFWMFRDVSYAYYGTDARLYQLLAGAALAIALLARPRPLGARTAGVVLLGGLVGIAVLGSSLVDVSPAVRGMGATVVSVAAILGAIVAPRSAPARLLARPAMVYLGKVSYGTYLWHWPVILVLQLVLEVRPAILVVLAGALATALAGLSFVLLETPVRRTPRLSGLSWPVVATGLAVSVVAALVVVPPVLETERRPALAAPAGQSGGGRSVPAQLGEEPVPTGIDWSVAVKDNGRGASCLPEDVEPCLTVPGEEGQPRMLLVGDSSANMLAPMYRALAEERGFSLAEHIVQGCAWPEDLVVTSQSSQLQAACDEARDRWYERAVPAIDPDLIVLAMRPRDIQASEDRSLASRSGRDYGDPDAMLQTMMTETVGGLVDDGRRVLLVQSVMNAATGRPPLQCLSESELISECAVPYPLTSPASDGFMQYLAAESEQVSSVDLNALVCPTAPVCLPYRDGQLVYRDRYHLMTDFAISIRDEVWERMRQAGATRGFGS